MMSVIVTFYRLGPKNVERPRVTYPPTFPVDWPGCINNALIIH